MALTRSVRPRRSYVRVAARVLAAEHQLYPRIVAALCAGRITLAADGTVRGAEEFTSEQAIPGAPPVP